MIKPMETKLPTIYANVLKRLISLPELENTIHDLRNNGASEAEINAFKGGLLLGFHLGANRKKHGLLRKDEL